jgi:hypothetical protein
MLDVLTPFLVKGRQTLRWYLLARVQVFMKISKAVRLWGKPVSY